MFPSYPQPAFLDSSVSEYLFALSFSFLRGHVQTIFGKINVVMTLRGVACNASFFVCVLLSFRQSSLVPRPSIQGVPVRGPGNNSLRMRLIKTAR